MAGTGRTSGHGAILVGIVLAGVVAAPSAALAVEDPTEVMPGVTVTALTIDLDGDGEREIVRLVQEENDLDHSVDAWRHDGARWTKIGSESMPRITEDRDGPAIGGIDAVALLPWRVAGRERVLVLSAGMVPNDPNGATCCLAISELESTLNGGIDLRPLEAVGNGAQTIQVGDVDGDGAEDLLLHEGRFGEVEDEQTATVTVLRWTGSAFEPVFEMTDRQLLYGFSVGNTDGVVGVDLLFSPGTDGRIRRLAWADGEMHLDEGHIDAGEPPEGWIVGVADDAIVLSMAEELRVMRWPRGQAPTTVDRLATLEYPSSWLIGDGPDAIVAVQSNFMFESGQPPTVTVHDLALRPLGEVAVSPEAGAMWEIANRQMSRSSNIQRNIYPYIGPIPRGFGDDRAAYVSHGMLIRPGGPGGYDARPIAWLIGVQPIGVAGPGDAWAVLGDGFGVQSGVAYLYGGQVPEGWGRLAVTPVELLLQPDDEIPAASWELLGAVETARNGAEATLLADGDGFRIAITAPAGSAVITVNGFLVDEAIVGDEPAQIDVPQPQNRKEDVDQELDVMILVITPGGRGMAQHWTGSFVREPPEISVAASTDSMALSATLTGHTSAGNTVRANDRPIQTDADGRFAASIDAPIWPSQVVVTARDPLGNETTQLIEVVGVVDYRGLPWAAILIAATLVVGGVLFVRTPKRRAGVPAADGDGRLEELELDAIEGIEPRGR